VKWIYAEIWSEKNWILMKELAATYKVKNTSLINDELIQKCYNNWIDEHVKVKRTDNFVQWRCNINDFKN